MKKEQLSPENYERLKIFIGKFFDWYEASPGMPPEIHPLYVLEATEKTSPSNAKRGVQMAVNDIIEMTSKWKLERVLEADAKFATAGGCTLSEVRLEYSKTFFKILERGLIRSETEYYLVKGIRDGNNFQAKETKGAQIEGLLATFEANLVTALKKP